MRRTISSPLTPFAKLVFAPLLMLMGSIVAGLENARFGWFFLAWCLLVTWLVWNFDLVRYKRVALDECALYVSNYAKEIRIPLTWIYSVGAGEWHRQGAVTIILTQPTEFGDHIVFMPRGSSGFAFWRQPRS